MSSGLRFSSTPSGEHIAPAIHRPTTTSTLPTQKPKMSLTQTYYLAHTARSKLSKEAARGDHNLRLLVGHANLLDGLMLDLAHAEQEQESWFNSTVQSAAKSSAEPKKVQWADQESIIEEEEEDEDIYDDVSEDGDDSDSESDVSETDAAPQIHALKTPQPMIIQMDENEDEDEDEEMDDDYEEELALTRSPTHVSSPPGLMHSDSDDSESDDDSLPPSPPPQSEISLTSLSHKQRQAIATTSYYQSIPSRPDQSSFFEQPQVAIAAY